LTCRGEALDPQEYHRLLDEREGRRVLTPINNDELNELLTDRALILGEIDALTSEGDEPGALQVCTKRIKELIGVEQGDFLVNGCWKLYVSPNSWSGLDVKRLREEEPETYKKFFVDRRATGSTRLKVYAMHDGKAG
jgi:hypothetical protein